MKAKFKFEKKSVCVNQYYNLVDQLFFLLLKACKCNQAKKLNR